MEITRESKFEAELKISSSIVNLEAETSLSNSFTPDLDDLTKTAKEESLLSEVDRGGAR